MAITDQQALEVISHICGDGFCEDLDMRADATPDEEWALSPDLKLAQEKLSKIYCIAHSMVVSNSCYRMHDDWRKEAEAAVAEMEAEKAQCR